MAFRSGNRRNFGGGNYGNTGGMGRTMNPWDSQNAAGGSGNFGNIRQGGGQAMNAEALTLANNLLNNLLRNQNPPSLLDLPRGGATGGLPGNRGLRQVGNRAGNRNRRVQGGFGRGQKSGSNKQGGIRKQNAFDRAKKLLAKNSNKKKDSASGDKTDKKKNESIKESIYADVPNDMFYCHLCKKHMWDSNSFENHIKGRTHLMMREGIEESYRLKANMIRQEAKIAEQLKMIELDRLKRMGKSGKSHQREYCTMCDLNFHGHLSTHRKSEGHLALKKFLHPKCIECNKEFPTRIEYDTHLLTPEHLKKAAERNTKVGERKKNTLTILTEEDEIKDVKQPSKKKKKVEIKKEGEEVGEEKKENGEAPAPEGEEEKKEGEEAPEGVEEKIEEEEDANQTVIEDPEDVILDYQDGDEIPVEVDARIPKYNWLRPVGTSLICKLECYECCLCAKFFDNEKTAEIHSRTVSHHRQFVKFLNEKSSDTKIAQKRAAAAEEENERKKRKLEAEEADEDAEEKNDDEEKPSDELYDPSEATGEGEDEDVEMNENAEGEQAEGENVEEDEKDDDEAEVNGKVEDELMKENEIKEEPKIQDEEMAEVQAEHEREPEIETESIKQEEKTEEKVPSVPISNSASTPATPIKTGAPPQRTQQQTAQKNTPAVNRGGPPPAKGTPRGRGRGRYNRY